MSVFFFSVFRLAAEEASMQVVYPRCCGLDVHKKTVTACVMVFEEQGRRKVRKKQFETHRQALNMLMLWLYASKVTHVAMESTGVYWKPVWNALEGHFQLILANPYQVKSIPSQKTDAQDSEWIADLLAHGLIRPSFVPPPEIRELRDLTRHRVKLVGERHRIHNRIHKVLEDASIKLDTVASDILGTSGRAIIEAMIAGEQRPDWLADKAQGSLRRKKNQLRVVLRGRMTDHHRWMLRRLMEELKFTENEMLCLEQQLVERMSPYQGAIDRLCTIPGVDILTAWTLIAELGADMKVFADGQHAASWAGLCPANRESAGKQLSHSTRKGNRWIRRSLCQSAWGASRKKNCYLAAYFYRKAGSGIRQAIVATAHKILIIAYHVLQDGTTYQELGGDHFDQLHPERARNRLLRRLERLGWDVSISPRTPTATDG
jgi:transposase